MNKLIADDDKVYTNGETYGKKVYLPDNANKSDWHQIDEADVPPQEDATEADKNAALRRFGVEV